MSKQGSNCDFPRNLILAFVEKKVVISFHVYANVNIQQSVKCIHFLHTLVKHVFNHDVYYTNLEQLSLQQWVYVPVCSGQLKLFMVETGI